MSRRLVFAFLAVLIISAMSPGLAAAAEAATDQWRLVEPEYRIEGFVLEAALDRLLGIEAGRIFESAEALDDYRAEKERMLRNERALELGSEILCEFLGTDAEGTREARLVVRAATSWNALALPYPKYSSDEGLSLALRFKDFNFLGTLEPLTLSLDWEIDEGQADLGVEFELMPRLFSRNWIFDFEGDFSFGDSEPRFHDLDVDASLTTMYPWDTLGFSWYAKPLVSYSYDSDDSEHAAQAGSSVGILFDALLPMDLSASLYYVFRRGEEASHSIRSGMALATEARLATLPFLGALSYAPSTEVYLSTSLADIAPNDLGWTLGQELSTARVDWRGNFRHGVSLSIANRYTHHFILEPEDPSGLFDLETSLDIEAFSSIGNLLGINSRIIGKWFGDWTWLGDPDGFDWDDLFRGYRPRLRGDIGVVANLELAINAAQGRFFGAALLESEVFIDLFLDLGFVRHDSAEPLNPDLARDVPLSDPSNIIACGGLEFVVYPLRARSFAYRLSIGCDLVDCLRERDVDPSSLEVFLGLGTHF